ASCARVCTGWCWNWKDYDHGAGPGHGVWQPSNGFAAYSGPATDDAVGDARHNGQTCSVRALERRQARTAENGSVETLAELRERRGVRKPPAARPGPAAPARAGPAPP